MPVFDHAAQTGGRRRPTDPDGSLQKEHCVMCPMSPADIRTALTAGDEFALIDVREAGQFGEGHLLHAVNIPYSVLERDAAAVLPNPAVRICVMDNGEGVAATAARRLAAMGYGAVTVAAGNLASFVVGGFTVLKGVNVPSKALGEIVEQVEHTPDIDPAELKGMIDRNEDFILLDGRSPAEFAKMSIPGAASCPNAELAYRLPTLVRDKKKTIIIHCAGRTRSIIGAQSLRNMGFENPIFALRNGTQGWRLAGFELAAGRVAAPLPRVERDAMDQAIARAGVFMARHGIPCLDVETAAAWAADNARTFYLVDVRTAEEYAAGHLPGAVHVAGGQLVQETDKTAAVRGARIVLCDDTGIRAANTAYWLRAMGHDACVLDADASSSDVSLPVRPRIPLVLPDITEVRAHDLSGDPGRWTVLDLRSSGAFRQGHIANAIWSIRPRVARLDLDAASHVAIVAEDRAIAEMAALDLKEMGVTRIAFLPGGPADWRAAGLEVVASPDQPTDAERIDFLFFVHDRHDGNLDAAREYLRWEMGLVAQMQNWELDLFRCRDKHAHGNSKPASAQA
jgi:rhodanese-related sulfurtransferase